MEGYSCGFESKVLKSLGQVGMKFVVHIHVPPKMNCGHFAHTIVSRFAQNFP